MKTLIICHLSTPNLRRIVYGKVKDYGFAISRGLFECEIGERELNDLRAFLSGLSFQRGDCVRLYPLCAHCEKKSLFFGKCAASAQQPEWVIF